jgi:membrane protease YdiL (CAAX protease family)
LAAIILTLTAYLAAQLIVVLPIFIASFFKSKASVQSLINTSSWFNLVLSGLSAVAIISVLWLYLKHKKQSLKNLGFRKPKFSDLIWLIVGTLVYLILVYIALTLASHIPGFNSNQPQSIGYQAVTVWQKILAFIGLVILPPLAEEMLFRGFLYRGLASRWPKLLAALVTSGLFAVAHLQWNVGVDVFVLSLVLIALYEKTNNLWVSVGLHALKNCLAFFALFIFIAH